MSLQPANGPPLPDCYHSSKPPPTPSQLSPPSTDLQSSFFLPSTLKIQHRYNATPIASPPPPPPATPMQKKSSSKKWQVSPKSHANPGHILLLPMVIQQREVQATWTYTTIHPFVEELLVVVVADLTSLFYRLTPSIR